MHPSPIFEAPLIRALLRTLLFAAILEALFYRLLTIPAGPPRPQWVTGLHESTGRAGLLMFFLAFLVLLPTLIAIAYATLRHPAWPGPLNGFVSVGLLTMSALAVSASFGPRGPAFALGFTVLGLALVLAMLAGFFERCGDGRIRAFAVFLGGSIFCLSVAETAGLVASMGLFPRMPVLTGAALSGGWWLLFAAGALAFLAFSPDSRGDEGLGRILATYGLPAATAFGLVFGVFFEPSLLSRLAPALGTGEGGLLPDIAKTGSAAAALFLVAVTVIRGAGHPRTRPVALGLLFLVLSGFPRLVAYQHLLSVLGVALVTASAPPARPRPSPAASEPSLSRPVPGLNGEAPPVIPVRLERRPPGDG